MHHHSVESQNASMTLWMCFFLRNTLIITIIINSVIALLWCILAIVESWTKPIKLHRIKMPMIFRCVSLVHFATWWLTYGLFKVVICFSLTHSVSLVWLFRCFSFLFFFISVVDVVVYFFFFFPWFEMKSSTISGSRALAHIWRYQRSEIQNQMDINRNEQNWSEK